MMNVAYRLKTRVILRDHGQQRAPDAAYSSFSHQLPFIVTPGSPNQATLDVILRAKSINNNSSPFDSKVKLVRASNESFQLRGSLSDSVASTQSPSAIEALVRLDQIYDSAKSATKITGKLIQVKVVYKEFIGMRDCRSEIFHKNSFVPQECTVDEGVTLQKKAELFNIRLDVGDKGERKCEELSIPFNLPSGLLPTLIEKDQSAKVSYHIQVCSNITKSVKMTFQFFDEFPFENFVMGK